MSGEFEMQILSAVEKAHAACVPSFDNAQNRFAVEGGAGCRVRIGNTVIELTKNRESGEISADPR